MRFLQCLIKLKIFSNKSLHIYYVIVQVTLVNECLITMFLIAQQRIELMRIKLYLDFLISSQLFVSINQGRVSFYLTNQLINLILMRSK